MLGFGFSVTKRAIKRGVSLPIPPLGYVFVKIGQDYVTHNGGKDRVIFKVN